MPNTKSPIESVKINAEAFIALSQIAFASVERLAALNLNATRTAFEEGIATSGGLLLATDNKERQKIGTAVPASASQNAAAYLASIQEIAADTQQQITQLTASYFSPQSKVATNPGADWLKGFDVFKGFAQQVTAMTEANSKAIREATARFSA